METNIKKIILFTKASSDDSIPELSIKIPVVPQSLSYSYSPNIVSQNVLGRMSPIHVYAGGSGEKYSFTVTLHEDLIKKSTIDKSIMEFVDDIKSLSYPNISKLGLVQDYPRVLFQLGDISAWVLVETNVTWNKPFRDGKYILAEIAFNLTVVETLPLVETYTIQDKVGTTIKGEYKYLTESVFLYTKEQEAFDLSIGYATKYGVNLENFISSNSSYEKLYITDTTNWDAGILRMKTLFGAYQNQMSALDKLPKEFTNILNLSKELPSMSSLKTSKVTLVELEETLYKAKDNYKKYLDIYYKDINLEITRAEINQMYESFSYLIDSMLISAEGVVGYGPAK